MNNQPEQAKNDLQTTPPQNFSQPLMEGQHPHPSPGPQYAPGYQPGYQPGFQPGYHQQAYAPGYQQGYAPQPAFNPHPTAAPMPATPGVEPSKCLGYFIYSLDLLLPGFILALSIQNPAAAWFPLLLSVCQISLTVYTIFMTTEHSVHTASQMNCYINYRWVLFGLWVIALFFLVMAMLITENLMEGLDIFGDTTFRYYGLVCLCVVATYGLYLAIFFWTQRVLSRLAKDIHADVAMKHSGMSVCGSLGSTGGYRAAV